MAIETIKTRIKNKVDTYEKWVDATGKLLDGEIALVRVPTGETYTNPVTKQNEPAWELLMKVGDGQKTFAELPWLSAKASDVYNWAKKGTAEEIPVTVNGTASTLGAYLTKVDTNASNISSVSAKVDVDKVSTAISSAISSAINALEYSSSTTDTSTSKIAFVTAVTQADGKIAVKKRNIIEDDLPDISASKVKVDSSTTLASKISTMDAAITANTNKLAGHTDDAINTLIDTKLGDLDSTSSGSGSYVTDVTQTNGKVAVTKGNLPTASASAAGIVKLGAKGGAATYDSIFGSDGKGGINKQVTDNTSDIANLKTAVAGGVHFRGTVSAEPSASTTTVGNVTIAAGDVVIYDGKEYICTAVTDGKPSWEQLGDVTRIGNLETKLNNLDYSTVADGVATDNKFVTSVTQSDGKIAATYARPFASNISYNGSDVGTKLGEIDAAIATKADTVHTHPDYINQNAFSNIKVGNTTVAADTATDTVELVGSNVTITPDATNDKITFVVAEGSTSAKGIVQLSSAVNIDSEALAATPKAVKSVYDLATEAKAEAAAKAPLEHEHPYLPDTTKYAGSDTIGGAATSANKVNKSITVQLNGGSTEDTNKFTFDGSTAKTVNITPSAIGAAASDHGHATHEARTSAIEGNYVRFNSTDSKLYVGKDGVKEIIFDCGGAE